MKKVRFIEPRFVRGNPSSSGLIDIAIHLVESGWEVEIFCHELDRDLVGMVHHRPMPKLSLPFSLSPWLYFFYISFVLVFDFLKGKSFSGVTITTGFLALSANISAVHYSHIDAIHKAIRYGHTQPGLLRFLILALPGLFTEIVFFWNPWKTRMLPVSESVAQDLHRFAAPWKDIHILPNAVINSRFNPALRMANRDAARTQYQFTEHDVVFAFASMGHHFRKGFFIASDAIAILRKQGRQVKMLVTGSSPQSIQRTRRILSNKHPDFEKWITFTGKIADPTFDLSAGDALLFPSLSEAFSAVEIEAAAFGLPLYLTPHHGSEMILEDGKNGRLLPWDSAGIAATIARDLDSGAIRFTSGGTGQAISLAESKRLWMHHISEMSEATFEEHSQPAVPVSIPAAGPKKPSLLLIGHTYMIDVNREKALALSDHFEVTVATSDSHDWLVLGKPFTDEISPLHHGRYELHRLERFPKTQEFTKFILRGLPRLFRELRPDYILVENEPWSLLRWQSRALAFMYCRDSVFCEFTWENVARRGFKGHILQWVYRATAVTSDLVIAGNQSAKTLLVKAGISPQKILVTGQLGIREEHFPIASGEQKQSWRTSLGWPEDALVIGFCGRLVPEKGILFLYAAAARLHRSFPKIRLAYLGSGPLETTLLENDTTAGILKILPPVPHLEVGNFLNKLDIFVLPSIPLETPSQVWEEQFGHVLIEAIVAGALTLGSDSGAIPEILADPEVTFQHSNLDALEKNLHRWVQSPSEITEKANRQKHDCLLAWSFDVLAARYATFLKFPPLHSTSTDSKS